MRLRLAVITELPREHYPFWDDGLHEALKVLETDYNVDLSVYNLDAFSRQVIPEDLDFYLFWGGLTSNRHAHKIFKKQGLLFGGGATVSPNITNFDIVFAESKVDLDDFLKQGARAKQAFGTNTKTFQDLKKFYHPISLIYPAAFAKWKRHDKFVAYVQQHLDPNYDVALAVGYKQPDKWEHECYDICDQTVNMQTMGWIPAKELVTLFNLSQACYVSADANGGCQRTILEAKACGLPVIVDSDSPKLLELKDLTPEEVREKWNEHEYARKIYEGILEAL